MIDGIAAALPQSFSNARRFFKRPAAFQIGWDAGESHGMAADLDEDTRGNCASADYRLGVRLAHRCAGQLVGTVARATGGWSGSAQPFER